MIVITPRAKWERMVCVTTLAEEREWWEMCRGTNPNHADRNFLVAPSSLPWRTPHSPLMRTLGLSFELKECCCTSVGGRKHGRHWIGKWFSANALRALIHNLRRNCKILHATHILFSILRTLPKAQRTWGLSSAYQSNLFRSYISQVETQILMKHLGDNEKASTSKSWLNLASEFQPRFNFYKTSAAKYWPIQL